jgi:hypothetical protein
VTPGAIALCAHACGTPSAGFALDVPTAVASAAAWYEVGVFSGQCPSPSLLVGGIPLEGTVGRLTFSASDTNPPGLGTLANQTYGLAAVARAADCSVIASGCATLPLDSSSTLTISLAAVSGAPAGACDPGTVCTDAICLPSADGGGSGTGCALALVGSGPLADPLSPSGTLLSPPSIVATSSGFLIAYREAASGGGGGRLTTIALDSSGGAAQPIFQTLTAACSAADGLGLVFPGNTGTLALATPPCNGGSGDVTVFSVTGAGQLSMLSSSPGAVTLASTHALASTPGGLLLAYTNPATSRAYVAAIKNGAVAMTPTPVAFGGLGTEASGMVLGSSLGTSFIATGKTSADAGGAMSVTVASEAPDASLGPVPAADVVPATWASAGAVDARVIVATSGPTSGTAVSWLAFDIGTERPATTGSFTPQGSGNVSFAAVALNQDHAFFAAEVGQSLSLVAFDKASTLPVKLREVPFQTLPTVPVGALQDGLVAVAASNTRVAVVWGTEASLQPNDAVGGYAVFACTP